MLSTHTNMNSSFPLNIVTSFTDGEIALWRAAPGFKFRPVWLRDDAFPSTLFAIYIEVHSFLRSVLNNPWGTGTVLALTRVEGKCSCFLKHLYFTFSFLPANPEISYISCLENKPMICYFSIFFFSIFTAVKWFLFYWTSSKKVRYELFKLND